MADHKTLSTQGILICYQKDTQRKMDKRIDYIKVLKPKVRRKGVHAKTKMSSVRGSKLYKKKYRGQGK